MSRFKIFLNKATSKNLYKKEIKFFFFKNIKSNLIRKKLLLIIINFHKTITTCSLCFFQSNPAIKNSNPIANNSNPFHKNTNGKKKKNGD